VLQHQNVQHQAQQKQQQPQQMVQIVYASQHQQQNQRAAAPQIYQLVSPTGMEVSRLSTQQQQQVRIVNSSGQAGLMIQQRAVVLPAPSQQHQQVRIIRAPPARSTTAGHISLQSAVSSCSVVDAAVGGTSSSSTEQDKPLLTHSWVQQQPPVISLQAPLVRRPQLSTDAGMHPVSSLQNAVSLPTAGSVLLKAGSITSADIGSRGMTAGSPRPAVMLAGGGTTGRIPVAGGLVTSSNHLVPR